MTDIRTLAGCKVLVTRPLQDAEQTAGMLRRLAYEPLQLPLSETVATNYPTGVGDYQAVAVTSANALRCAKPEALAPLLHLKVYAVGEKTASVARDAGFTDVYAGDGWGLHLGQYVAKVVPQGSHVLYLTGKIRRPDFEAQLQQAGLRLSVVETYDTKQLDYSPAAVNAVMAGGWPEIILLYSAVAAQQLVTVDAMMQGNILAKAQLIFCLSQRIANELPPQVQAKVRISAQPDEPSLLKLAEADC